MNPDHQELTSLLTLFPEKIFGYKEPRFQLLQWHISQGSSENALILVEPVEVIPFYSTVRKCLIHYNHLAKDNQQAEVVKLALI